MQQLALEEHGFFLIPALVFGTMTNYFSIFFEYFQFRFLTRYSNPIGIRHATHYNYSDLVLSMSMRHRNSQRANKVSVKNGKSFREYNFKSYIWYLRFYMATLPS